MTLSAGDRVGRFQILGPVGAGGMGEVYRARDPHLERDVAIKVLPDEFSADAVRRRRFEQEARAAGGLNHPNILAVHDVGLEAGLLYIVTEMLEGQTLAGRLGSQALSPRKAVEYALQIASGLAAAHERGVVHRDIKPGNLFITSDDRIKILDFGLAKFVGADSADTETVTVDGDAQPSVIGSVTYMSPEQARGLRIDHRTDIFSFGVVLYEMLAGYAPFRRSSPGDTLRAILHDEPAPLSVAPELDRIVRHCLEKQPPLRFQHVRDLIFDLESRTTESALAIGPARPGRQRPVMRTALFIAGALTFAGAGAYVTSQLRSGEGPPATTPVAGTVPRVRTMTSLVGLEEFSAISPDGKMVAFTVVEGTRRQIYVRYILDSRVWQVTRGDDDHIAPRWLPGNASLLYFSPAGPGEIQGAIYRIPALGGAAERVVDSLGGCDVSVSGRLTNFRLAGSQIELVTSALDGTGVEVIAQLPRRHYGYPRWSPDGRWIAYQGGDGFRWDLYTVAVAAGSKPVQIARDAKVIKGLSWLPDSTGVVYATARASTFPYLPPLSLWSATLAGRVRQLTSPDSSYEQPDVHAGGQLSATKLQIRYDVREYPFERVTTDVTHGRQVTRQTGQVAAPTASPGAGEVAYLSDEGGHANIWVINAKGTRRQITFETDPEVAIGVPAWSPDGEWIAYLSSRGNVGLTFGIWLVRPDTSDNHPLVPRGLSPTWSTDGEWIYYVEQANTSIRKIAVTGGSSLVARPETARNVAGVDGSTIYYVVDLATTDGRQQYEIRAAPVAGGPERRVFTIPLEQVPAWQVVNPSLSPDGRWLAMPLTDGFTTNIWAIATTDGKTRRVTDFGNRVIFIARRVSWTKAGTAILAAIGEGDADVVIFDELLPGRRRLP
jgi:Tol biopolymer transport system component